MEVRFEYPEIPPSVNKLYAVVHGRKILTKEGRAFKNGFVGSLGGLDARVFTQFHADPLREYELDLWFYVAEGRLYNIGFGVDKRVQSPFADFDVDNLVKVTADAVAALVGIRDRNNFDIHEHKRVADARGERVVAILRPSPMVEGP